MNWLFFAFASAIFESLKDLVGKYNLANRKINPYLVGWGLVAFTMPVYIPIFFSSYIPLEKLSPQFWLALLADSALSAISNFLYIIALEKADLSLVVPMVSFSPIFLIFTSYWLLGEIPKTSALLGVLLVVAGAYILNTRTSNKGIFAPLLACATEPASRMMLGVAFCWGFTSALDKIGVQNSSPLFFGACLYIATAILMTPGLLWKLSPSNIGQQINANFLPLLVMGILFASAMICQLIAVKQTFVIMTTAIKRTSLLWAVLWGHFILKEPGLRERLLAATVMLIGAILVIY